MILILLFLPHFFGAPKGGVDTVPNAGGCILGGNLGQVGKRVDAEAMRRTDPEIVWYGSTKVDPERAVILDSQIKTTGGGKNSGMQRGTKKADTPSRVLVQCPTQRATVWAACPQHHNPSVALSATINTETGEPDNSNRR